MDKDEFCSQIRACENAMYSLAYSIVRNEHDACDVVSESILNAYSHKETLKNQRAFKTWILRIVHNNAVALVRKECHTVGMEELPEREDIPRGVDTETRMVLQKAVSKLKAPYRTAVTLYYYENLPARDIARIMEVPMMTVRQYLSRARKQLKELLVKEGFVNE